MILATLHLNSSEQKKGGVAIKNIKKKIIGDIESKTDKVVSQILPLKEKCENSLTLNVSKFTN